MIQYAAEHLEELNKEMMKSLPNEIISEIVQNKKLKLSEEDSLLEFLLKLYEKDHSNANLFEFVLFSNVSTEKLEQFVNEFEVEYINQKIFQSICNRFFKTENLNENRYQEKFKAFKPKEKEDGRKHS